MTSALSLTLIMCLVASGLPATAQTEMSRSFDLRGRTSQATPGPLTRAVTHEAVRLAAAGEPAGGEAGQQSGKPAQSNWSRVQALAPGTEIIVTVTGTPRGRRYFAAAATKSSMLPTFRLARPSALTDAPSDEPDLIVLNVADLKLPPAVRDVLRTVASRHADYVLAAQNGGEFVLGKTVRMGPDGVFVADRKVADLGQIVENIERTDVLEISTRARHIGRSAKRGAGIGALAGAVTAGPFGIALTVASGVTGAGYGAIIGALVGTAKKQDVIYRAP